MHTFEKVCTNLPPDVSVAFLRSVGADIPHFSSVGTLIYLSVALNNAAREIWLLDVDAVHRLNVYLWPILKAHFNLKIFSNLDSIFYAQHAFQLLLILFFNRIQHTKPDITQRILTENLTLSTRSILTQNDNVQLLSDLRTLSIQQNILTSEPPWIRRGRPTSRSFSKL
jgi:hypothetical protein